ncbi:MAG: hypothetical protein R3E32_27655 [Chitinophagales bacterium]
MKSYQSIPFFVLTIALLLFTTIDILACGPMEDPYENRVTFFNADVVSDTSYRIAYWDAGRYRQELPWDATLAQRHSYNVADWQRYFEGKPNADDIAAVVYDADTILLQKLYNQIAFGKPYNIVAPEWKNNTLLQYLYQTKDIDAINYLVTAKQCEPFAAYDPWNETEKDPTKTNRLIQDVLVRLQSCRTDFIKLRYAYQAIRLALYTGRYEEAIDIYTKKASSIIGKNSENGDLIGQSIIRYWTMALRAGAHKRLGQNPPAMYGFSRIFLESPDKKELALQNFEYTGEQDWQLMLELSSRVPGSAAALWMLRGLKNKEQLDLEVLQKMYEEAPESGILEVMLIREINKIEQLLLSPSMTKAVPMGENADGDTEKAKLSAFRSPSQASIGETIQEFFQKIWNTIKSWFGIGENIEESDFSLAPNPENKAYIQDFKTFIDTIRIAGKVQTLPLWHTASAYLDYLLQNYDEAYTTLNLVANTSANPQLKQQAILVRSLANLAQKGKMDEGLENSFYEAIKDLPQPEQAYENFSVYSRTLMHIAQHYMLQGDIAKSFLCFNRAKEEDAARILIDFYASQTDLETLRTLAVKPNKTAFEAHLFEDSLLTENLILDLMATKMMRNQQFEAALKQYQKISPEYWQTTPEEDTWFDSDYNNLRCDFDHNPLSKEASDQRCNKMEFAQKVVDLLQNTKDAPAESYYKLGNAFVNTPFWGYVGNLWQGSLIWTLREYEQPVSGQYGVGTYPFNLASMTDTLQNSIEHFIEQYGTRDIAMNYYKKVLDGAKNNNRELGAKAAYLAKYCQENPQASIHAGNDEDPTYAKILINDFGDTEFFKEIIEECPDLKAYR